MEEFTDLWQKPFSIFGYHNDFMVLNMKSLVMTWVVMGLLILFAYFATRKSSLIPRPIQVFAETLVNFFYNLVVDTLDENLAKKYFPLICSLFMFLFLCNWMNYTDDGGTYQRSQYHTWYGAHGRNNCSLFRYQG